MAMLNYPLDPSLLEQALLARRFIAREAPNLLHFVDEFVNVLEVMVDAGEANIGDLILLPEFPHHALADELTLDLAIKILKHLFLDLFDQGLYRAGRYRPLVARSLEPLDNFVTLERLSRTVLLDDLKPDAFLDPLPCREPTIASQTLPPPADRLTALAGARVDNLVLVLFAKRALHIPNAH